MKFTARNYFIIFSVLSAFLLATPSLAVAALVKKAKTTEKSETEEKKAISVDKAVAKVDKCTPITFSVYFNGTGSSIKDDHYEKSEEKQKTYPMGELISTLFSNDTGLNEVQKIQLDGPGSGNHQLDFFRDAKVSKHGAKAGIIVGAGTSANIKQVINVLTGVNNNDKIQVKVSHINKIVSINNLCVENINVIGWSRGAVTAIDFANTLYQNKDHALAKITINLVLIDPVPGLGNMSTGNWKGIYMINGNVVDVLVFYASDEFSFGFTPILPELANRGSSHIFNIPGRHATLVGGRSFKKVGDKEIELGSEVAQIVRDAAEDFLIKHGTVLKKTLNLTRKELLANYDIIKSQLPDFENLRREAYLGKSQSFGKARKIAVFGNQDQIIKSYWLSLHEKFGLRYTFIDIKYFAHAKDFVSSHHEMIKLNKPIIYSVEDMQVHDKENGKKIEKFDIIIR